MLMGSLRPLAQSSARTRRRSLALPIDDLGPAGEEITHLALQQREPQLAQLLVLLQVFEHLRRRCLILLGDVLHLGVDVTFGDEQLLAAGYGIDQEEQAHSTLGVGLGLGLAVFKLL